MGTPVPDDWPEVIDGLWYKMTVRRYILRPGETNCGTDRTDTQRCCVLGETIRFIIQNDLQCNGVSLCSPPTIRNNRIINLFGPFDTQLDCFDSL